jgi:hypothetical protein
VPEFLSAMSHRRRIRIRDGAQQWALLRDLENPDIWTESYHVPTWVEYALHNERRTPPDAPPWRRLRPCISGPDNQGCTDDKRQTVSLHDDMPLAGTA